MASVTARLSMMGDDGYGEQEKDANSQLVELDKGDDHDDWLIRSDSPLLTHNIQFHMFQYDDAWLKS